MSNAQKQLAELEAKLDEYKRITSELWRFAVPSANKADVEKSERYYEALSGLQSTRKAIEEVRRELPSNTYVVPKSQAAIDMEEKRAIKESLVTSATHERWKAKMSKQAEGFVSGK